MLGNFQSLTNSARTQTNFEHHTSQQLFFLLSPSSLPLTSPRSSLLMSLSSSPPHSSPKTVVGVRVAGRSKEGGEKKRKRRKGKKGRISSRQTSVRT